VQADEAGDTKTVSSTMFSPHKHTNLASIRAETKADDLYMFLRRLRWRVNM